MLYKLENVQRAYTAKVNGLRNINYWDRLAELKLFSIERRIERYRLLYIRKILIGIVPNCGLNWDYNSTRGLKFWTPKVGKYFTKTRESFFSYTATRLYNQLPRSLRDDTESSMEVWKKTLDLLLSNVPDTPRTQSLTPPLCNPITAKCTNSLLHWLPHLNLNGRVWWEDVY